MGIDTMLYRKYVGLLGRINNERCRFRKILMQNKDTSFIAMFHDIMPDDGYINDNYSMRCTLFRFFIESIKERGFRFVSLRELLTWGGELNRSCILTFDDAYESLYSRVRPFLREMNIPFTAYITTSYIDTPGHLSSSQLKELSAEPLCTIGMHAHNHLMFRYETAETLEQDFIKCRSTLENITGIRPEHYAFPYGSVYAVSEKNIMTVRSLNVSSIAMTNQVKLTKSDIKNPYRLPRINMPWHVFRI